MNDTEERAPEAKTSTLAPSERRSLGSRVRGGLLAAAGWGAVALGLAGAVLPLVPTTPFLLLAGACFARSSPRLNAWLLAHPRLGPYLEQWRRDRSVPAGAKGRALFVVVLTFAVSILVAPATPVRLLLVLLGIGVLTFVARLRTT